MKLKKLYKLWYTSPSGKKYAIVDVIQGFPLLYRNDVVSTDLNHIQNVCDKLNRTRCEDEFYEVLS